LPPRSRETRLDGDSRTRATSCIANARACLRSAWLAAFLPPNYHLRIVRRYSRLDSDRHAARNVHARIKADTKVIRSRATRQRAHKGDNQGVFSVRSMRFRTRRWNEKRYLVMTKSCELIQSIRGSFKGKSMQGREDETRRNASG